MDSAPVKPKCIIVLSTKSAGSSALQELLCKFGGGRHVAHTRHGEFETLYWTKAASVLGLSQLKLPDSEVPIPRARAERELRRFLEVNARGFEVPIDPGQMIFDGWKALCRGHAPAFIEKSPHHLHQWSCLELMLRAEECMPDIDFRFVGLVRSPMDVLYSAWTRWKTRPETLQHHWRLAYENLERLRGLVGSRLLVVRYEDFSSKPGTAEALIEGLGLVVTSPGAGEYMHAGSVSKWKTDDTFGFQLDPRVADVAGRFGYPRDELANPRRRLWTVQSCLTRSVHVCFSQPLAATRRRLRRVAGLNGTLGS